MRRCGRTSWRGAAAELGLSSGTFDLAWLTRLGRAHADGLRLLATAWTGAYQARFEGPLLESGADQGTAMEVAAQLGDEVDDADRRNAEQTGMAVDQLLRARWAALQRAEARLAAGSYGRSVRSGEPIPDERLEADPLAELTVQEAAPEPSPGIHIEPHNQAR